MQKDIERLNRQDILPLTLLITVLLFILLSPPPADATPVTLNLNEVTFQDGGTATGTFTYDPTTQSVTSVNVIVHSSVSKDYTGISTYNLTTGFSPYAATAEHPTEVDYALFGSQVPIIYDPYIFPPPSTPQYPLLYIITNGLKDNNIEAGSFALTSTPPQSTSYFEEDYGSTGIVSPASLIPSSICAASLSSDLSTLLVPIVTFAGQDYWADFQYVPNTMDFALTNAGLVADSSQFSTCSPATLSSSLQLQIPTVIFRGVSYWADFQYDQGVNFTLAGAGENKIAAVEVGTYTYSPDTITFDWTSSTFPSSCGPELGTESDTGVTITSTTMTWPDSNMTWTRTSGTAGDIVGAWTATSNNGNSYTLTFDVNGTVTLTGTVLTICN
jgi:hypothetical protein